MRFLCEARWAKEHAYQAYQNASGPTLCDHDDVLWSGDRRDIEADAQGLLKAVFGSLGSFSSERLACKA